MTDPVSTPPAGPGAPPPSGPGIPPPADLPPQPGTPPQPETARWAPESPPWAPETPPAGEPAWAPAAPPAPPELARFGSWPRVIGMLALVLLLSAVLSLPVIGIMSFSISGPLLSNPFTFFLLVIVEDVVFLGLIYFVLVYRGITSWKEMGLGRPTRRAVGQGLLWGAGFVAVSYALEALLTLLRAPGSQVSQLPLDEGSGVAGLVVIWISAVILAPFAEEVFFRGYLFRAMAMRKGLLKGLIYSSVIFGAMHIFGYTVNLAPFLPIAVGSVLLALGYRRSGNLWVPMTAHAVNNFVAALALTIQLLR